MKEGPIETRLEWNRSGNIGKSSSREVLLPDVSVTKAVQGTISTFRRTKSLDSVVGRV